MVFDDIMCLSRRTMRSNCPAFITLRAAKCGQKLEVIDVCNQHNHPISEQDSRSLPQNRRLPPDIRDEVLEMLRVHIDRKKIFEYIRCKTGKQLNNKNLLNLRTIYKHSMNTLLENVASEKKRLLQKIQLVCGTQPNGKNMNIMESYDDFDDELFEIPEENIIDIDDIIEKEDDGFSQVIEEIVVDDNESYEHCQVYSIEMGDPFNSDANDSNDMLSVDPHKTENNDDPSATDPIEDIPPIDNRYDGYDFSEYYEYQPSSPKNDLLNNDPILDTPKESLINQPLSTKSTNTANFTRLRKTKTNKTRNRNCRHCGLNARLVRMQIAVLEAEKEKLVEETQILRLTKERLLMETAISGNVDDDDGALVEIVNEVEENQFEC